MHGSWSSSPTIPPFGPFYARMQGESRRELPVFGACLLRGSLQFSAIARVETIRRFPVFAVGNSLIARIPLGAFAPGFTVREIWWPRADSNHRHKDFQSSALPTELLGLDAAFRRPERAGKERGL